MDFVRSIVWLALYFSNQASSSSLVIGMILLFYELTGASNIWVQWFQNTTNQQQSFVFYHRHPNMVFLNKEIKRIEVLLVTVS